MGKPMTVDLTDKVVIVTGAGGAIGSAMALDFARNGAKVIVSGRTAPTLEATAAKIKEAGGEASVIQADVGDKASAAGLIEQTVKTYGRLDVLVNNAGINGGPEYRKNDNCFVEQKNDDIVRNTVGYSRLDTNAEQAALAGVHRYLCPLINLLISDPQGYQENTVWKREVQKGI
jgi:NAD(P)-dependent dehydrogenase (short-subunit alcohol dehydrogenase family)